MGVENICSPVNAPYWDCGYITVCVCQNSHSGTLKRMTSMGYKL